MWAACSHSPCTPQSTYLMTPMALPAHAACVTDDARPALPCPQLAIDIAGADVIAALQKTDAFTFYAPTNAVRNQHICHSACCACHTCRHHQLQTTGPPRHHQAVTSLRVLLTLPPTTCLNQNPQPPVSPATSAHSFSLVTSLVSAGSPGNRHGWSDRQQA